jgi:DNA modification methylase
VAFERLDSKTIRLVLLDLTDRGEIVIDPFLGSGSTLIAAEATGRVCRGVELDPASWRLTTTST